MDSKMKPHIIQALRDLADSLEKGASLISFNIDNDNYSNTREITVKMIGKI